MDARERFAFQGRVFETADADGDGLTEVRPTELVLAEVVRTFKRMVVDEVIDLQVEYADGETATITGTHEHPFYVPAAQRYVQLGDLEPGDVLRTDSDNQAVVVDLTRHEGEFEVFNIEVGEAHNYFVRASGFGGPGILVHNKGFRLPLRFDGKQFGKHGGEFGFPKSADGVRQFRERAQEVVSSPGEIRRGSWNPKGGGGDDYIFYSQGDDLVITNADGDFVTMFKQQPQGNRWFNQADVVETTARAPISIARQIEVQTCRMVGGLANC